MSVNAVPSAPGIPEANGNVLDVLLLQVHVVCAAFWLLNCVLVALIAVPQLRRVPSPAFLHELQARRAVVLGVLAASFVLTLGTGTYLLFHQAIYDPPVSAGDFDRLRDQAYGLPYYYALYAKIAMFLAMGLASFVLAREANRTASLSEAAGGPRPEGPGAELRAGANRAPGVEPVEIGTVLAGRPHAPAASTAALWSSVGVLAAGAGGVGFCVTLIKYFHELARAAVVYEQLRSR